MRGASDRDVTNVWEKIEDAEENAVIINVFVIGVVTQSQYIVNRKIYG